VKIKADARREASCIRVKIRLVELNYIPLTDLRKKIFSERISGREEGLMGSL